MSVRTFILGVTAIVGSCYASVVQAAVPTDEQREFFERKIRPVLVERCYQCHNSADSTEGGLALDHRDGLLRGGNSGKAILSGRPRQSLLIRAIRHEVQDLKMPRDGPKLAAEVVADFARWIDMGAPDPRDDPPTADDLAKETSWESIRERRKQWWSFQPVSRPEPPQIDSQDDTAHPVDRFIFAKLREAGLQPAEPADRRTLIRRLSYALTGLPPSRQEIDEFLKNDRADAYEQLVERLLTSDRFGERWARHWMDWFRYAESHGSEGDPAIPQAWRYRDYLIRSLNADIPFDQLVREHIAGDLLPNPRIDRDAEINESALGIAHYRFVQHGFFPTDALDEQVNFTENQIDVLSKAFMGLTVSCARCHNHKFDAISQSDFYALYGIMVSARPAVISVDTPKRRQRHQPELAELKARIQQSLADVWRKAADDFPSKLRAAPLPTPKEPRKVKPKNKESAAPKSSWQTAVDEAADRKDVNPLHAWNQLRTGGEEAIPQTWEQLVSAWRVSQTKHEQQRTAAYHRRWDLTGNGYHAWYQHGNGLPDEPSAPGSFALFPDGDQIVRNIYPAGIFTHLLSNKHNGVLTSPRFQVGDDDIWVRALGGGRAQSRYVMQNYPRAPGTVYPMRSLDKDEFEWRRWNMDYWQGDHAYLELTTAADLPVPRNNQERSWFGVAEVLFVGPEGKRPQTHAAEFTSPLFEAATDGGPSSLEDAALLYSRALKTCIDAWASGNMTDGQANFLAYFVRRNLLPNDLESVPQVASLVEEYRNLEKQVPVPIRSPGVLEGEALDHPLFVRGNHKQPGEVVPRRFLEAIDATPYKTDQSGRLELAEDILRSDNPLTSRVIVNRVWNHIFGRGIVATPDNFGRLGERPTHPQLLDYLASRFVDRGWSLKELIRFVVTSKTYRLDSVPSPEAQRTDPNNRFLSHASVRRLEAEAIRDAILAVSGRLDHEMYGPSVGGEVPRRSVYVKVRRNSLDPVLSAFDAPPPVSTKGRRDVTNVPAQSLTLMNDAFVIEGAEHWATLIVGDRAQPQTDQRITAIFETALGRKPFDVERDASLRFLEKQTTESPASSPDRAGQVEAWQGFVHAIFNLKEFIYLK